MKELEYRLVIVIRHLNACYNWPLKSFYQFKNLKKDEGHYPRWMEFQQGHQVDLQ